MQIQSVPNHLAIIMDGNGRWAHQRGRARTIGHVKGTRVAKEMIRECSRLGVKYLTLYAFSSENWFRPQSEVSLLMKILRRYLKRETENLIKENIRFTVIGDFYRLPEDVMEAISAAQEATANCNGLQLIFALSYSARAEILSAAKAIAHEVAEKRLRPEEIDEATLKEHLFTRFTPDPDLVIRTSGEYRISNFLLWQLAYSELYFSPVLWPDFKKADLQAAFADYAKRQRRFGRTGFQVENILN